MSDDDCAESLRSPSCAKILFGCLRNVEKQMKDTLVLAKSAQEQQIKGERQLNDYMTLSNIFQTNSKIIKKIGQKRMK